MKAILCVVFVGAMFLLVLTVRVGRAPMDVCVDLDTQRDRVMCNDAVRDTGTMSFVPLVLVMAAFSSLALGAYIWWREKAIDTERAQMQQTLQQERTRMQQDLQLERMQMQQTALTYAERIRQHYGRELQSPTQLYVNRVEVLR